MIGLSILLIFIAYIWLARVIVKRIENRSIKYVVIAIFILIPIWDVIPGQIYFNHLCEKDSGLKIYKVIEGVDGYLVYPNATGLGKDAVEKYDYVFEERGKEGRLYRYTLGINGEAMRQVIAESSARYAADGKGWTPLLWNVNKYQVYIFDQTTQEQLAIWTKFSKGGNWLQDIFHPFLGGGSTCKGGIPEKDLYLTVLKPANTTY